LVLLEPVELLAGKIGSEMTYNVSTGTLNRTMQCPCNVFDMIVSP